MRGPGATSLLRSGGLFLATLLLVSCASTASRAEVSIREPVSRPPELVVLVHGMGRTPLSMVPLARTLEHAGYRVLNWGYSSTCCGIDELGAQLQRDLEAHPAWGSTRVHFVGHSLGSVLIRWVLARPERPAAMGHVVMLAPPNQGSHAADRLSSGLGWLLKPLPELRTDAMRSASSLAIPEEIPVGVIAGRYDGKVSVEETYLPGMDARVVVPATHSFLMFRQDVRRLVVDFLREGRFDAHPGGTTPSPTSRSGLSWTL